MSQRRWVFQQVSFCQQQHLRVKEICDTPIIGAGGLFYTEDAPGRWKEKVAGHLPNAELVSDSSDLKVKVVTSHPMDGYNHYIVKHMLLNQDLEFIAEHMFDPSKDAVPVSEFSLGHIRVVYMWSVCVISTMSG